VHLVSVVCFKAASTQKMELDQSKYKTIRNRSSQMAKENFRKRLMEGQVTNEALREKTGSNTMQTIMKERHLGYDGWTT